MGSDSAENRDAVTDSAGRPISQAVVDELRTAALRIRSNVVAFRVWERVFTEEDRQKLGGDIEQCWPRLGTAGMWREARGGSLEQAVIDVANAVNLLDDNTANWLRRELDMVDGPTDAVEVRPVWDAERGELHWGNDVIRRVRVLRSPTNIQQILDAFQAAGWPNRIDNPLSFGQEPLHQTLRSLNRGLETIRFHGQEGAEAITWKRI